MNEVEIIGNSIIYNGTKIIEFNFPIKDYLIFKEGIAVCLLNSSNYYPDGKNVFFVDFNGNILWQISHAYIDYSFDGEPAVNVYVGLIKENDTSFWACNSLGFNLLLDTNGNILDEEFVK